MKNQKLENQKIAAKDFVLRLYVLVPLSMKVVRVFQENKILKIGPATRIY